MLGNRLVRRNSGVAAPLQKLLERSLNQLAARQAQFLGGLLGFLEQGIGVDTAVFIP
jgi:hypothetical protein